jgi:hypothetical protein
MWWPCSIGSHDDGAARIGEVTDPCGAPTTTRGSARSPIRAGAVVVHGWSLS